MLADEPVWIQFFTAEQLTAEMLYMAADLGECHEVQRLAPGVLGSPGGMERRRVLCTTALASSYLPRQAPRTTTSSERASCWARCFRL
ncbi:MAG TPA: hypothetical protein VFO16_13175 [Pseudonocardiaceae bacterium]|nr:hypothetical protein [Pseudonocardiaceae bacterium]